jgi:HK97 family phage major capsid protein
LVTPEYSNELIGKVNEQSAVLRLAKKLRNIPGSVKTMPVLSALPTAYFVTGDNGLKQTSQVTWANRNVTAEEIAVLVPIPQAALDDADTPIWDEVKPLIEEAAAVVIDAAVLYGTGMPASWITDIGSATGLVGLATTAGSVVSLAARTDMYDALMPANGVLGLLEAVGFIATGHIAHVSMRGGLRNCRDANGNPIFNVGPNLGQDFATGMIDGVQMLYPLHGGIVAATALDIAGQWNQLVFAWRQDMNWMVSDQGVITDNTGAVVYNLFQEDMVALRMTMRLGFAVPNPINRMQAVAANRCPFSILTP